MTFDIRGTKTESDNLIFNNFVDFIKGKILTVGNI